jgi:hypothetical protein
LQHGRTGFHLFRASLAIVLFASAVFGQDPDDYRFEITGSYWPVHTSGTIQANGTPVDLRTDLGVSQNVATFTGKAEIKLGRNRIEIEGTPFRLDGTKNLSRSITYQGRVYPINDRVASTADLDYFFAGYQFDVISRPAGHLALEAGGAYLNATGAITSQSTSVTESKSVTVGLPLAGIAFRAFPVRGTFNVEINGEVKGMNFGPYGHYIQATANVGIGRGPVLIEGGYRFVNADIRGTNGRNAVTPEFRGPLVSAVFRF